MSNVILDGEVQLGADGVLQGWCWNPNRPTERLVLEILIDERIVSTFVASRFRDDLRGRNIGDGYYGFIATLTKSLLDAGDRFVVSVRERASGCCFWREVRGESGLPYDFAGRLAEVRQRFSRIAWSSRFRTRSAASLPLKISTDLGTLGTHLRVAKGIDTRHLQPIARARTALLEEIPPAVLEIFPFSKVAVIIIADSTSNVVLSAISAVVPALKSIEASLLLIDRGSNAEVALAPTLFGNLRYIREERSSLGSLLTDVLKYSHGDLLLLVNNPEASIARGLPEIVTHMHNSSSLYINARSMEVARRICAVSSGCSSRQPGNFPIGLVFAGRRELFERINESYGASDNVTGVEDVDLAIRAIRDGIEICAWGEPPLQQRSGLSAKATH